MNLYVIHKDSYFPLINCLLCFFSFCVTCVAEPIKFIFIHLIIRLSYTRNNFSLFIRVWSDLFIAFL